jgi:hypothetical protein
MDPTAAYRVAIRVPAYVEQRPDGLDDYHVTANFMRVVDKDTTNWMDFNAMLAKEIVHGKDQALKHYVALPCYRVVLSSLTGATTILLVKKKGKGPPKGKT